MGNGPKGGHHYRAFCHRVVVSVLEFHHAAPRPSWEGSGAPGKYTGGRRAGTVEEGRTVGNKTRDKDNKIVNLLRNTFMVCHTRGTPSQNK